MTKNDDKRAFTEDDARKLANLLKLSPRRYYDFLTSWTAPDQKKTTDNGVSLDEYNDELKSASEFIDDEQIKQSMFYVAQLNAEALYEWEEVCADRRNSPETLTDAIATKRVALVRKYQDLKRRTLFPLQKRLDGMLGTNECIFGEMF